MKWPTKKRNSQRRAQPPRRKPYQKTLPKALKKPLKYNKSAAKQHFKTGLKLTWREEWSKSPRVERLKHIDPSLPSQNFLKLTSDPKISRKGVPQTKNTQN